MSKPTKRMQYFSYTRTCRQCNQSKAIKGGRTTPKLFICADCLKKKP